MDVFKYFTTFSDFVEQYVKDTIAAALTQWKKDYEKKRQTLE